MIDLTFDFYEIFAQDTDYAVQESLITRVNLPSEIIGTLALNTRYLKILAYISSHPYTSPEILHALSNETNESIKIALASNSKTPIEILLKLSNDSNDKVSFLAKKQIHY